VKESLSARDEPSIKVDAPKSVIQESEDQANREVEHVGQLEEEEEKVPMTTKPHPKTPSAGDFS
jgi:hypothetical protein